MRTPRVENGIAAASWSATGASRFSQLVLASERRASQSPPPSELQPPNAAAQIPTMAARRPLGIADFIDVSKHFAVTCRFGVIKEEVVASQPRTTIALQRPQRQIVGGLRVERQRPLEGYVNDDALVEAALAIFAERHVGECGKRS